MEIIVNLKEDYPAPLYKATQFISFTINTFGGLAAHGECDGRDVDENGVWRLYWQQGQTLKRTWIIVPCSSLKSRRQSRQISTLQIERLNAVRTCLKSLPCRSFIGVDRMAPTRTSDQIYDVVTEVFEKIDEYISDDAFEHYLFVFGTVITIKPPPQGDMDNLNEVVENAEYRNFAQRRTSSAAKSTTIAFWSPKSIYPMCTFSHVCRFQIPETTT